MRLSWVLTVLSICLSALVTATVAEGKRKLQIGVKKRVDHCPIKSRKGDVLHMHYTGKLEDGTEFDSSLPQNQPFVFSLGTGQVIKGWDQGLLGMCEGEKRKLVIPSELGKRGMESGELPQRFQVVQPWCSRWNCSKSKDVQSYSQTGEGRRRGPQQGPSCLKQEKTLKPIKCVVCVRGPPERLRNHCFSLPAPSPHPSPLSWLQSLGVWARWHGGPCPEGKKTVPACQQQHHSPQLPSHFQLLVWEPAPGYRHGYVALRKACGSPGEKLSWQQ